jgi:hypothetical protein
MKGTQVATNANPVDASRKDEEGVKEVQTHIPGVGDVTAYFLVETVDDVDQKTKEDVQTLRLSVPVEAEEEVEVLDAEGDPVKNGDGSIKLKTETYWKTVHYEVDLGPASREKLEKALAPFLKNAREATAPVAAIREWAKGAGHSVKEKGRIAGDIIAAYYRSTGKPNPDA